MRRGADSLRGRLQRLLALAALVLLLLTAGATAALLTARANQEAVTGPYFRGVADTHTVYLDIVNAETGVRGYLLSGDEAELAPLTALLEADDAAAEQRREEDLEFIQADADGRHDVVAARDEAAQAAQDWYFGFVEPALATAEADGVGAVTEDDRQRGREAFDELQVEVEEYIAAVRAARADAIAELEASLFWAQVALIATAAAPVVVGVLLWVFLRRWVTDPLAGLADDARTVATGRTDHRVRQNGVAEVGEVSRDVEAMRERLAALIAEATAAREEVEASHALLRDQAEDLRRSNRDLEQFAYVASHDLQEPLRKVASFTQLLAKRYEGQLDERADQYIGYAVDGAKRMQRLINDLLGFSRVGRIGGELTEVPLDRLLAEVCEELSDAVEAAGAVVEADDLPVVVGEEPLLRQLLVNLLGNALKFRHPDRSPVVRFTATSTPECWELACGDNGIGIDAQYAERVFVIFQRLHAKDVYEGTGIGLALCKKIVEYHGGAIWVDPDVAEGTTIRWTLPREPQGHTAGDLPTAEPEPVAVGGEEGGSDE